MLLDQFGLKVNVGVPDTVAALDSFANEILSHGKHAATLLATARNDPHAPLVQAYAGALHLFLQTTEGVREAVPWLKRAREACAHSGATERELLIVSALERWAAGSVKDAAAIHMLIAERWPSDLLNIKLAQMHHINLGDVSAMTLLCQRTFGHHTHSRFAWGIFAFAQEQAGQATAAEQSARRALDLCADDPWAQHALAHAFEAKGAVSEGIAWMRGVTAQWDRCSSFMYTHNWWHLALMHLDNDEPEEALWLYDHRVWGVRKTYVQDQINAVSLLSRLECRGVDVGNRWADISTFVAPRIHDQLNPFIDIHYGYALARAGCESKVEEWLASVSSHVTARTHIASGRATDVFVSAARGMVAYANSDLKAASHHLEPIAQQLHELGGSNAQQDWFEQVRLFSLLGTKQCVEARALLAHRTKTRPGIQWQHRCLASLGDDGHTFALQGSYEKSVA